MIATMPEPAPARSQAASNEAPAGFHRVALGLDGSGAILPILRSHDNARSPRRIWLIFIGITAVHDQVSAVQRGGEEPLVALEFQFRRHHPAGIRQHAVGRHDDVTFNAQRRRLRCHGRQSYCEIVCTTLETGRVLTVGNLASFRSSSSYCGNVCTGALATILTTL